MVANHRAAIASLESWASSILTPEARRYALWELSRRAGVTRDQFDSWRIEHAVGHDVVWINGESPEKIDFPLAPAAFWKKLERRAFEIAHASWMFPPQPQISREIPDFIVPFASERIGSRPLFQAIDSVTVICSLDLLTSLFLTLSRFEETIDDVRDEHGRFPSSESLAVKHGFLERPIVDEYGFALQQALSYLLPTYRAPVRELRVKLSHDIDDVGAPFRIRAVAGHTWVRHCPSASFRDLASAVSGVEPAYLSCVRAISRISLESGLDSALYWKSCAYSAYDSGYSLSDPKVQAVVRWAGEQGIELGAHPGYHTFSSCAELSRQLESIRNLIGTQSLGGRQHYLRWCPETWKDWESCGMAYDSTVGYADRIGFRAGTSIPYMPWLLDLGREARLLEIPLTVMDVTVAVTTQIPEEQFENVMRIVAKCRLVGGVFTLLWHNNSLMDSRYGDTYFRLINHLAGAKRFRWEDQVRAPRATQKKRPRPSVS